MAETGMTYSVNQQLPVLLSWSPKGFARSYQFQISTNQDFSAPAVSVSYQNNAFYVWTNPVVNTTCYYRSKTVNEGGESDWSVGSFQTVPPFISLTFPNGGEALQRGLQYFIRWQDNLTENVAIDLYTNGTLARTLVTNAPNTGAYQWQVGFDLAPGPDYSIRIVSTTNASLSASSAASFSIVDTPAITMGSVVRLANGAIQFGINLPGATQVSVLGSTNLSVWQLIQTVPLSGGTGVFTNNPTGNTPVMFYRVRVP
jgi:hypothetical protein